MNWVGQPVYFFVLYSYQAAPYSSGITGAWADRMPCRVLRACCCFPRS